MKRVFGLLIFFGLLVSMVASSDAVTVKKMKNYINLLERKIKVAKTRNNSGELEEFKEEVTEAISILNSKIASVKKSSDKGATVHGRAYVSWVKDLKNGSTTPNQFDLSRVYIDFKKKLDRDADVRFTTDIARDADNIKVYLKYAYFGLNNLKGPLGLQTIRVGQSATHWIDFMQKHWKFRYLAKTLTDNYKFFSSADMGVAAIGYFDTSALNLSWLRKIDYHAIVMNGSGYKDAETNTGKDVGLTLKLVPLMWGKKDYVTTAIGYLVEDVPDGLAKKLTAMTSYQFSKPRKGIVFVEYASQADSATGGIAIGGQYQIISDTNIFGRLDNYKKSGSDYVQNIVGAEYSWGENVKLALAYTNETKDGAVNAKKVGVYSRVKW
ncbi:MAG: hypothetical protein HQ564_06470 [Candidatus Saganbacteria bacterium]|nr:hypothetical protein [Candidatus Saganbacteria bacterium]